MVVVPKAVPVTVTEQVPPARVHVVDEKDTIPDGDWDHVTVPVGVIPVTVAEQMDLPPTLIGEGVQETVVEEAPVTPTVA